MGKSTISVVLAALALGFTPGSQATSPRVQARPIPDVRLDPLASEEVARQLAPGSGQVARQVGIGRVVMALRSGDELLRRLSWEAQSDGDRVAALSVTSPGAVAIRVGLRIHSLPRETILRFYGADGSVSAVTNEEVRAILTRNMDDDDELVEDTRVVWSPVVSGETLVLEIDIPEGASPDEVQVAAPALSHLGAAAAGPAEDRVLFTRAGSSFLCPASYVAGGGCFSSQTEASTLQRY